MAQEDPVQLLNEWYYDRFPATTLGGGGFGKILKMNSAFQTRYNSVAPTPCVGGKYTKRGSRKRLQRCRKVCCPVCWHRRQIKILQTLVAQENRPDRYWYIRYTDWQWWRDGAYDPLIIKRFKAVGNVVLNLVCHSMVFDASTAFITPEDERSDPFSGEVGYRVSGVYYTDGRPYVPRSGQDGGLDSSVFRKGRLYAVGNLNCTAYPTIEDVIHAWLKELSSIWQYRMHECFNDYLAYFDSGWPMGRSWSFCHSVDED